jgi:L-fuculokinase
MNVIAIFDVGKTNKKILLFNVQYQVVLEQSTQLPEMVDEDGFACEDVEALYKWLTTTFEQINTYTNFVIKAVNFTAYGASFVYINEYGNVVAPLYNYLKPLSKNLQYEFCDSYGGSEILSVETASPVLGNLNSGMQLFRIKNEKPQLFAQIKYALHLPQYLSFILTQKASSDITSIGCHTNLWNFNTNTYHSWLANEQIAEKLAPIEPSNAFVEKNNIKIGMGLHDSSAALIPYLVNFKEPFILISTGTWCISLNPFNKKALTKEELEADCLCYLQYNGKPVKASRIFAGNLHEQQIKRIANHYKLENDFYKKITFSQLIVDELKLNNTDLEFANLALFATADIAYHQLMMDIVKQQVKSTNLIITNNAHRIFVDGGFSKNTIYLNLLAAAYPSMEIYATHMAQATALGAALALHTVWNTNSIPDGIIELTYYSAKQKIE